MASAWTISAAAMMLGMLRYDSLAGGGPMHTVSSARRTCIASESAVEWTATVLMPISWQARWMRSAISPRLAISSFWIFTATAALADDHERLIELDRLAVRNKDLLHHSPLRSRDRVHHLHRFDDQQSVAGFDRIANLDERLGAGLGRQKGRADHRRFDAFAGDLLGRGFRSGGRGCRRWGWSGGSCRRGGDKRRGLATHLHPAVAVLDFDLGQLVLGQQLGELAHQRRIDAHRALFLAFGGFGHCSVLTESGS